MKIQEIMAHPVWSCRADASLATAANIMIDNDCGFVPIVDTRGIAIGVVTDRDICRSAVRADRRPSEIPVLDACTRPVFVCSPTDDIHAALLSMRKAKVRRLAVTRPDGHLLGVVSMTDILKHAGPQASPRGSGLSYSEAVTTLRSINAHELQERPPVFAAE